MIIISSNDICWGETRNIILDYKVIRNLQSHNTISFKVYSEVTSCSKYFSIYDTDNKYLYYKNNEIIILVPISASLI